MAKAGSRRVAKSMTLRQSGKEPTGELAGHEANPTNKKTWVQFKGYKS